MWNTQAQPTAVKTSRPTRFHDIPAGSVAPTLLGASVAEQLYLKAFCSLELGLDSSLQRLAQQNVGALWEAGHFQQPPPLIVDGLLGDRGSSHITALDAAVEETGSQGHGEALRHLDDLITDMGSTLAPLMPQLGFEIEDRTAGILHQNSSSATERPLGSEPEPEELTELEAQKWLTQFWWHRLMVCIFLGPDDGELELLPYGDEESESHSARVTPGTMVVLRPDVLAHFFSSQGRSWALTAFFMQPTGRARPEITPTSAALVAWISQRLQLKREEEAWEETVPRELQRLGNHLFHKGPRTAVRSMPCRLPSTWDCNAWMSSLVYGPDVLVWIPSSRWEHEAGQGRYDPDPQSWQWGRTNVRHGAFAEGLELFDNKTFSLSIHEAKGMDPGQRMILEASYEGLWDAGLRKKDFFNSATAVYVGHTSSEWNWAERCQDSLSSQGSGSVTCIFSNRVSYCLGLKGPSTAVDQEGASAITAVHLSRLAVEDAWPNGDTKGGRVCSHGISLGCYLILSLRGISLQHAAGYMAVVGRCLSFDASASGIARGESVCGCIVKPYVKTLEGSRVIIDPDSPPLGVLASTASNHSGMATDIRAPHGPALQEIICNALEEAHISPLDVDSAEIHGEGRLLPDVVDISTALCALRQDRGADISSMPLLALGSLKSNVGHMKEACGASALIKAILNSRLGMTSPGCHLKQLNPHLSLGGLEDLAILNTEALASVGCGCSFTCVLAHGQGGSNSQALVWNTALGYHLGQQQPRAPLQREALVFWPGGGGELPDAATDCQAYHILGSWTRWEDPQEMEPEAEGVFGFTLVLGENGYEHFQILLDADGQRVLHPGEPWAPKNSSVFGPDEAAAAGTSAWTIDGRRRQLSLAAAEAGAPATAIADEEEEAAAAGSAAAGLLVDTTDTAEPGEAFRVRLKIAGKWRVVTWERLDRTDPDSGSVPDRSDGSYYITGDFNAWTFDPMAPSYSLLGQHTGELQLLEEDCRFQLVRDCSWDQVFQPSAADQEEAVAAAGPVVGPVTVSSVGGGRSWHLKGLPGDIFRIQFQRLREAGRDVKNLSWQLLSSEAPASAPLSSQALVARGKGRLFLQGSWDDWEQPRPMSWDGSAYTCRLRIGREGIESFQVILGGAGLRLLHPSRLHAGPHRPHTLVGPTQVRSELCWTIGYHPGDAAEPGSAYLVRLSLQAEAFSELTWDRLR